MARRKTRNVTGCVVASVAVVIGMWLERFNIVVPTSLHPRLQAATVHYTASWVELSIMAGTLAGFVLVYMVATKFFPIISIWEIQEGRELSVHEVSERVASYLPDDLAAVAK
jgi:molybdopterin-containing oxidoreductase family membrane subunit